MKPLIRSMLAGAIGGLGLAPAPVGARPPAERVGQWEVEARGPDECAVDRRDSGGTRVFLSADRGGARTLIVNNPRWPAPDAGSLDRLVSLRGGDRLELKPPGRKVELGAEPAARVAASDAIEVVRPDGSIVERVDLSGLAAAAARLPACLARAAEHVWQVVPAPPPVAPVLDRGGRPPRAEAGLHTLFSELDYPSAAIRAGEQGIVAFRVLVGTNGRVAGCEIIASSGSATLDSATCALLAERARFTPAEDSQGRPALGFVPGQIVWRLSDSEPQSP
ncbi:MAG TPA: energy transducer TonB, partial [Allosphingosinicella sp.]|nr:energy transducer TonB [Allosphingosinicella sp.]